MSRNLIDNELLEKLQRHFRRANDVYLTCMDRDGNMLTKNHASDAEVQYVKQLFTHEDVKRLLDTSRMSQVETIVEEQLEKPYAKLCGVVNRVNDSITLIWVVVAVIEELIPTDEEIPEYVARTSDNRFYRSVAFLEALSRHILMIKEQELEAKDVLAQAMETDAKLKEQLRRSEGMATVVRQIESDDSLSDIGCKSIREVCETLGIQGGCIIRLQEDGKRVDSFCEYSADDKWTLGQKIQGKQVEKNQRLMTKNFYREDKDANHIEYVEQIKISRRMAKECIYMGTEFESALNEQECIEKAALYYRGFGSKQCFICLYPQVNEYDADKNMFLRHYLDENGESVYCNIPFKKKSLLPDEFLSQIEGTTSIFYPVHCKNEIYGYVIIQLKEEKNCVLDEKYEFLNLSFGNALKKNYMYYEIFSVKDVMQMYLQDPLTEIFNRRGYDRKLVELHQMFDDGVTSIAMVSIDMDGLKQINDTYGHAEGDKVLRIFSQCLQSALKDDEFCARIGGDEFAAALIIDYPDRAETFREKLNQSIWEENCRIEKNYRLEYSMGICLVKEQDTFIECMHKADERMYKEKKGKR